MQATVALIGQKGGSGRTTLAIHLAVEADRAGVPVVLVDTDPQATAALWGQWRGKDSTPEVLDCAAPPLLAGKVAALRKAGAQLILIDTPPHANATAVAAASIADIILIPVRARAFDLAAARATADLVKTWKKPAWAVFMSGSPTATTIHADAAKVLGVPIAPVRLPERADFHVGLADGQAAQDLAPTGKAAHEVAVLWAWLRTLLTEGEGTHG